MIYINKAPTVKRTILSKCNIVYFIYKIFKFQNISKKNKLHYVENVHSNWVEIPDDYRENRYKTLKYNMHVFVLGLATAYLFEHFQPPWESWRLRKWEKSSPDVTSSHKLPLLAYFQLNFPLHAKNYTAICQRTPQAFTHERICLRSGIIFGHKRARYACNKAKYWWLMTSHVANSLCSSAEVHCSFDLYKIMFLQNWHFKLNLEER